MNPDTFLMSLMSISLIPVSAHRPIINYIPTSATCEGFLISHLIHDGIEHTSRSVNAQWQACSYPACVLYPLLRRVRSRSISIQRADRQTDMIKHGVSCDSMLVCLHYSPINPFPPAWAPSKRRISTCKDRHPRDGQTLIKGWPALPMPGGASVLPYSRRLAGHEGPWGSILPGLPSATLLAWSSRK